MQWTMHRKNYPVTTGYQGGGKSPAAIAATVAIHVAVAALVLLIPTRILVIDKDSGIETYPVPTDPLPPPVEPPREKPKVDLQPTTIDKPKIDFTEKTKPTFDPDPKSPPMDPGRGIGAGDGGATVTPPHTPVFVAAGIDPRRLGDFQPDYPGAMIRAQIEGFVRLRAFINAEGRVTSVELVEATDSAFWEAARKQALRRWRFIPATRDGVPVASERVMTVRFRLADLG